MRIFSDVTETIGRTPLVKINKLLGSSKATVIAKLESFNPSGCVKERIALGMIEAAEKEGLLKPGGIIVEPTSGNTGIGLATVAAARGYKLIITMPESMSIERRKIIGHFGAEIVLTAASEGMRGAIKKAEEIAHNTPGAFMPQQFDNQANVLSHYKSTGPEIWEDTDGQVDILVCGIGTGGTISGTGKYLKEKNSQIKIVGVEPEKSPVLSGGSAGPHGIQGIGAGFVPSILNRSLIDEIVKVSDMRAIEVARELATKEGILCGISCGAAMAVALEIAMRSENAGKNIVVVLPDTGERYLSTALFE
ncbi:MAG: cysteine synthase A [Lentisphaeria bacterium]